LPWAPSQSCTTSPTTSPKLSSGTTGLTFSRAFARTRLNGAPTVTPSHSRTPLGARLIASVISSASHFTSRSSKPGTFLSQYCSMLERGVRVWLAENVSVR
jgi:hypothetical protein